MEHAGHVGEGLPPADRLSQLNVLQQIKHLRPYPLVRERLAAGTLRLHGWWFDIGNAQVHAYRPDRDAFVPIDEVEGEQMLAELAMTGVGVFELRGLSLPGREGNFFSAPSRPGGL